MLKIEIQHQETAKRDCPKAMKSWGEEEWGEVETYNLFLTRFKNFGGTRNRSKTDTAPRLKTFKNP